MKFNKLALAAAVAAAPTAGVAMEPMNDGALSDVSGQDGITISLQNDISTDVVIHDTDGLGGGSASTNDSGAILLSNVAVNRNQATDSIDIDIDANNDTSSTVTADNGPTLHIGVSLPNNLSVDLGELAVADSGRTSGGGGTWTTSSATGTIIDLGSVQLGATNLDIDLGNEPQGDMIAMNTTVTGGVELTNFAINDANSGGSITMGSLNINDAGGDTTTDLNIDAGINATTNGLVISVNQFGDSTNGADIRIADMQLGDTASTAPIGDVEILGLDITGDVTVSGH